VIQNLKEMQPKTLQGDVAASRGLLINLLNLLQTLRARFQVQRQTASETQIGSSRQELIDGLYEVLWDRILHAVGPAVVENETRNWPKYFDGLRNLTRKVIAESRTIGLSEREKMELARRLVESIDQLEHELRPLLTGQGAELDKA
jgi:hypothetical protein